MIMIMCPYSCCLAPAKQQEKHLTFSELFPESLKESAALLFFFFLVSLLTVATLEKSECLLLYALAYLKRNQNENNVFYSSS